MSRKNFYFLSLLLLPFIAKAQDTTQATTLTEVTVTATRSQQSILAVPRSVSVITAGDIRKLPYQNLADLLQRYEGLFIPGTYQTPGSLQTLYLRGADNKQTIVMVDGIRLSDASTPDNGLDFNEVSLANIERIEIVRGSQGTLYGGSAVGGVINMITKKNTVPGYSGMVKLNAGTFGKNTFTSNLQGAIGYTAPKGFYARAEVVAINSDGFNSAVKPATGFFIDEKDGFKKLDLATKVGYSNNTWDVYAGYRNVDQDADIDDGAFQDDENYTLKLKRNLYTYGITRKFKKDLQLKFFGGYTDTRRSSFDDSSLTAVSPNVFDRSIFKSTYTGNNFTNEVQINYAKNKWEMVSGIGYTRDEMNTRGSFISYAFNFTSNTNYDTVGLNMATAFLYTHAKYVVDLSASNKLNLAGGLRYSNNNRFGNFVSFEFTPGLQLGNNVALFATYATGYNAPSLYQLFAPETNFTSKITRGFSGLQAEESRSIELGMKAIASAKVGLRASVYHNRVKNYIDYVYLWTANKPIASLGFGDYKGDTYLNTGTQTNKGVEAGADINFCAQWQLHTNATYNEGQLQYDPSYINVAQTKGNQVQVYSNGAFLNASSTTPDLIRRPKFMSNTSLVYKPCAQWQLTADARTVGQRSDVVYNNKLGPFGALDRNPTEDFVLYNLSAAWQPSAKLMVSASCFNLLNKTYTELNGFNTRGRSVFATVQVNF